MSPSTSLKRAAKSLEDGAAGLRRLEREDAGVTFADDVVRVIARLADRVQRHLDELDDLKQALDHLTTRYVACQDAIRKAKEPK